MRRAGLPALTTAVTLAALAAPAPARAEDAPATADDATVAADDDAPAPAADAPAPAPAKTWTRRIPVPSEVWAAAPEGVAETPDVKHRVAIALSSPLGWRGGSFGGSMYVALDRHHALRGNVAFFENSGGLALIASLQAGVGHSAAGRIRDAGAAWVWYPRRLWDGFTFEAGVLVRERKTWREPEFEDITRTASITYAGRAQIGWSWLLGERVFVSIAGGLSAGRETGTESIISDDLVRAPMKTTRQLDRLQIDGEGYLRFGFAFGQ